MKVLKEGVLKTAVKVCDDCKCEMEYNNTDMYYHISKRNPPMKEYYIICPYCGKNLSVNKL